MRRPSVVAVLVGVVAAAVAGIGTVTVGTAAAADPISHVADVAVSRSVSTPFIDVPVQVAAGDRLVLVLSVSAAARTATAPAGWTLEGNRVAGTMRSLVWSRTAGAGDAGSRVTVTLDASAKTTVQLAAYRGVDTSALTVASAVYTTSSTSRRTPAITADPGDWVTSWWSGKSGAATSWTPQGLTARSGAANTGSGRMVSRLADPGAPVGGGADGDRLATSDAATGSSVTWSVVLPGSGTSDSMPTAAFTQQCTGLTCSFDGSGSSDPEGPLESWSWTFGDGSTGSGEMTSRTYAAAGSYSVTLTVRDGAGTTGSVTRTVVVGSTGGVTVVASDDETTPVGHTGDTADDPAIWVHPTDPSRSLVIGNDKHGALEVYDLDGTRLQQITSATSFWGNVDVRQGVDLGDGPRDVVAAYNGGIRTFEVDPTTRTLVPVGDGSGTIPTSGGEGLCSYHSSSGALYVFVVTRPGRVRQYLLHDSDGDGLLQGTLQREFQVGSEAEGCAADDASGILYVSEEDHGLWRYGAEPTSGASRTLVDAIAPNGHLAYDVEGVTLVQTGQAAGYLIVSAQNGADPQRSYFAVYDRQTNDYISSFRIGAGPTSDGCERTDGIAAYAGNLGPAFPAGLFVCQDNGNTAPGVGNQDFKYTALDKILPVG